MILDDIGQERVLRRQRRFLLLRWRRVRRWVLRGGTADSVASCRVVVSAATLPGVHGVAVLLSRFKYVE